MAEAANSAAHSSDSIPGRQLAALDLGSNSFHLLVAQEQNGRLQVVDKIKEMVRLADGLDEKNKLTGPATERALECLERFSQRLRGLESEDIRVVGTNTLRRAKNAAGFLAQVENILNCKVEIISGREEARLIYLGVSHALEDDADSRLVIDIGGGSTELILGQQFRAEMMESLHIGCVGMTQEFFSDGKLKSSHFDAAINRVRQELEPFEHRYRQAGWDTAIGASGTIMAVRDILAEMDDDQPGVTLSGLEQIQKALIDAKHIDKISLNGLSGERAPVIAGGLCVLRGIFHALDIELMQVSGGALREGLIHDLLGRVKHRDVREHSVADLTQRYHIDLDHARHVRESAISLLAQVASNWSLKAPGDKLLLTWAADLHEIGMDISHSQYHRHGGYLLQHMDLPGFSRLDQLDLATLVRAHRRKFPVSELDLTDRLIRLAVLLRISVVLHRNRLADQLPHIGIRAKGKKISLRFPEQWLEDHPLTLLDLNQEAARLDSMGYTLTCEDD